MFTDPVRRVVSRVANEDTRETKFVMKYYLTGVVMWR
jgi:hypothetical protein